MKLLNIQRIIVWAVSVSTSFFAVGFLGNFYPTFIGVLLLTLFIQLLASLFFVGVVEKAYHVRLSQPVDFFLVLVLFVGLFLFALKMFGMLNQFPRLFDAKFVLLENKQIAPFLISSALSLPCLVWGIEYVNQFELHQSRLGVFLEKNKMGLLLAGIFFAIYFPIATTFNQPAFDVDDIFFDTDGLLWRTRFTTDAVQDYYWRSVHPFVLLLIRPLVTLISFFLEDDKLAAAYLLVALIGACCVFLTWYFVKHKTNHSLYAALIASLLGSAASHLVFSSLIETYIFLAAIALLFMVFLLKDSPFFLLVITGVISFGITLSNFVQQIIAYIFVKRNFLSWVKFGLIVGVLVISLTLLNNFVYPDSQPYFFISSSLSAEAENTFTPSISRAFAVGRVMILHSIVAPAPLLLEEEIPFVKVWIFKADPMRLSEYETGFGSFLAIIWFGFCLLGGFLFLKNFRKQDNRFSFTFILILLFNFFLHLRYGKDLFLYSTNWTYALILFLSIAWVEFSDKRWFQISMLMFIFLLLANNFHLINVMLNTSALHIK